MKDLDFPDVDDDDEEEEYHQAKEARKRFMFELQAGLNTSVHLRTSFDGCDVKENG